MPLSNKTILDSHCFVHELKTEMHDDLEYVKSLEKEIDELESEKADFSNIYDLLLEECVSKDVICSYLHSLSDLNAHTGLQCLYLHKVKECECLAQKLSKQTESVNKEVHNNLLKSFSKLEKHSISLELALQQCKEQMKNNSVCKENGSNVFRKEREQYHEIQDLKAQMQDKNIAISELKKLIENCKGKSVETQFNKPSVVRQPNAQRIPKPSNLPQIRKQAVRNTNVIAPGPSRNCPKHVSHQSPREKVGSNDMVHNYYLEKAKKSAQLQKDKDVNGKPSMIDPARLPNTANGCKPKPRNWQASMSSRVSNKDVHLGEHRKQKPFLKFNDLQCPTCKKCLYSANHDECVLEYLSRLNPRASAQNKDAKSHKTTKRYMPVEKSSASKKPERQIPTGHRFSNKKTTTVPEKTRTPRSCLRWQPTGRILKTVCLRWVPTGKLLNSCTGKVENEPTHGSNVDIPHIHACKQTLGLSAGTSFNGQKQQRIDLNADALYNAKQENLRVWPRSSMFKRRLITADQASVFMAMTSDHNRSELRIHDHSNEPSSSKLVLKVVPLAVKTATSRQELELLFHHHIAMLRTTGINPMIQPEPEDLPKDNPKLEIAVLRFLSSEGKGVKQNKGTNAMNTAVNKEINDDGSKLVLAEDHGKPLKHRNISTDTHNGVDVDANSYAHCVNAYLNVKKVNFRTLLALAGNGADVRFQWIRLAKRWSCNANPSKKDLSSVLVLVKFHDPITAFTYDALSVIATKLDLLADIDLKDTPFVAFLKLQGD
ncbi:hypothetical protein Tco_1532146 [Tanacetum coccineum]